jgi:outer membrane protein assembly factor BamA
VRQLALLLPKILCVGAIVLSARADDSGQPPPRSLLLGESIITLSVDAAPHPFPKVVVEELAKNISGLSLEAISQEIIEGLSREGSYKDIVVEKTSTASGKPLLAVSARNTWKIESIEFENALGETQDNTRLSGILEIRAGQTLLSSNSLSLEAARVENSLRAEGFLKAQVRYQAIETQKGMLKVVFAINRGTPCLLADFAPRRERIPVFKAIRSGDLCNKQALSAKIREEEARLRNLGYIGARIAFNPEEDLTLTTDLERATLRYTYFSGERWFISIVNRANGSTMEEQFMQDTGFVLGDIAYSSHEEIRQQIESYFRTDGFADAVVATPEVVQVDSVTKRLVYELDLGNRAHIIPAQVEFVGDVIFDHREALDHLELTPGIFEMSEGVPFVETELERKRIKLVEFLVERGYLDAEVETPQFFRNYVEKSVRIRFKIKSGKQYLVASVALLGKPEAFVEDSEELDELLKLETPLQPTALRKVETTLQSDLMAAGYRAAYVEAPGRGCKPEEKAAPTTDDAAGKRSQQTLQCHNSDNGKVWVDALIRIHSGPLFRIGRLTANDVPFGKGAEVLAASGLAEGEVLSTTALAQARDRILKHGLFSNVVFQGADNLDLAESEKKRREVFRDIAIIALPPRTWNLTLNPSWSSDRGYGFRADFQRNNLSSDGLQFFAQGAMYQERYQNTASNGSDAGQMPAFNVSAGLKESFFRLGSWVTPFDFNLVTVGHEIEVRDQRKQTSRVQSDLTWRPYWFGIEFTHRGEASYSYSGYPLGGVSQPVKVIDQSNNVGVLEFQGSSSIDTRNNPVWPRSGLLITAGGSYSGKKSFSDVEFSRYFADASSYFPYSRSWSQSLTLGTRLVSSVKAPGNRREKISAAQVRGFPPADAELGPLLWYMEKDTNGKCVAKVTQAAATNVTALKTETRYRKPQASWGGVFFYDTAGAYFTSEEARQLNNMLRALSNDRADCYPDESRVIGNDAIDMNLQRGNFVTDYFRSSYQSAGAGLRLFIADMFAIHLDWGVPTRDPSDFSKDCVPYSNPDGRTSRDQKHPVPPKCVSRSPNIWKPWDSPINYWKNTFNFLLRTQISIEGKF